MGTKRLLFHAAAHPVVFSACLLAALLTASGYGQVFYARVTGSVTDASKAVVPGATVTVTNADTNIRRTATTDASGIYNVPALPPGNYALKVEAPGFQPVIRKDVRLETNQVAAVDVQVSLAAVAQAVEVTGEVPILQTETSSYGTVLEAALIREMPLIQRDVMGLVSVMPGIIAGGGVGDSKGGRNVFDSNFSVAGGRTSTNEVLIDGAPNTIGDFNGVVIIPPQDSVQEFKVETSTYSAEFGRSGGGVVNMVTKSGANEFHGGLYDYLQNTLLNSNSFGNNRVAALPAQAGKPVPKGIVKRNQYGGTFGGPLWIPRLYKGSNKTFFFVAFEGRRERNPLQGLYSVPTDLERKGDFSKTVAIVSGQPQLIQIFDPFTARLQPNGRYFRDPLAGNMVPAARQNPIAPKVLTYYPVANRPGDPVTGRSNYWFEDKEKYSRDLIDGRVDHVFNEKHRLFGRFSWQENLRKYPDSYVQFAEVASILDNFRNVMVDDTYTLGPRLLNNFRASYARFRANQFPRFTLGFDPTTLGLPNYYRDSANVLFFPNFSISGFTALGGRAYNNQPRDTQALQNQVVWTKGKHTIRPGLEWRLYRFYPFQVFNPVGSFSFAQTQTQQDALAVASPTQGFGLASFLLGVGNFGFEHGEPLSIYHHYFAVYIQDDWKLTPKLTLNIGLRWEMESGTAESHGRLSYFDPRGANAVGDITLPDGRKPLGAMFFTTGDKAGEVRATNRRNFGPRIGFAYRLTNRTSVRGGYGIFYLPVALESATTTTPFNYSLSADVNNIDYTPKVTLNNPFPAGLAAPASARPANDGSYLLGVNVPGLVMRDEPAPYIQEWNFGIARQISRATVLDATYYGSRGIHLPIPNMEFNQINSSLLQRGGTYLNERVPNPFYGKFSAGMFSQPTVPRMQLLKPFPQFAPVSTANAYGSSLLRYRPPVGDSIYHAVTFKVDKRLSQGLSLQAHYTISKLIDIGGVGNGNAFNDPSALRDIYNIRLERSLSAWDVPQRLIVNYNWELPFGKGKWFLKGASGVLNHVAGGWSVHSIHTWQSGRAVAVGGTDLSRLAGAGPSRVDVVPGVEPRFDLSLSRQNARDWDPRTQASKPWFNPLAFAQSREFTIPNGPRLLPTVRGDNVRNWDFSVRKSIRVNERFRVQGSGEFFNFLNQTTFGVASTSVTSTTFGSASASSGRNVQLGLKLSF